MCSSDLTFNNQPVIDADTMANGSIFLTSTGEFYGCGDNSYYTLSPNLALGNVLTPQKNTYWGGSNPIPSEIKSSNGESVLIKTTDGKIMFQGYNGYGLLANGSTQNNQYPTEITYFNNNQIEFLDIFKSSNSMWLLKK